MYKPSDPEALFEISRAVKKWKEKRDSAQLAMTKIEDILYRHQHGKNSAAITTPIQMPK